MIYICVVLFAFLVFMAMGTFTPNLGTMQEPPDDTFTNNSSTPNVGYTIFTPTYTPPGTSKDNITTQNISDVPQVFQIIKSNDGGYNAATLREGKYDSASVAYWVCPPGSLIVSCSQIGVDKNGNKIYKTTDTIGSTFWGIVLSGTFINIEANKGSVYTDQFAINTFNTLQKVESSSNAPNISGAYTADIQISKTPSIKGEDIKFAITMKNGGQAYANQLISFDMSSGTSVFRGPFAQHYIRTDSSGHATVHQVLPWSLLGQNYQFNAGPVPIDITNDTPGSVNNYHAPPIGEYLVPLLLVVVVTRIVFRKKPNKLEAGEVAK